jgi:hypothetical protein
MCAFDLFEYGCGHGTKKVHKHCHFARNDPAHSCYGAWTIHATYPVPHQNCGLCMRAGLPKERQAGSEAEAGPSSESAQVEGRAMGSSGTETKASDLVDTEEATCGAMEVDTVVKEDARQ